MVAVENVDRNSYCLFQENNGNRKNADWMKWVGTFVKTWNVEYVAVRLTYKNYHHELGYYCALRVNWLIFVQQMRNVVHIKKEFVN